MEAFIYISGLIICMLLFYKDVTEYRLPNILVFTLFLGGITESIVIQKVSPGHILTAILLFGGLFWFIAFIMSMAKGKRAMGAGDTKLSVAAGMWLGPWLFPDFVIMAAIFMIPVFYASRLLNGFIIKPGKDWLPFGAGLILSLVTLKILKFFHIPVGFFHPDTIEAWKNILSL